MRAVSLLPSPRWSAGLWPNGPRLVGGPGGPHGQGAEVVCHVVQYQGEDGLELYVDLDAQAGILVEVALQRVARG